MGPYDEGQIIGYRPEISYTKEDNSQVIDHSSPDNSNALTEICNSHTLGKTIDALNFIDGRINSAVQTLKDAFKDDLDNSQKYTDIDSLIDAYISNNSEYANEFVTWHRENINGSNIPEAISLLKLTQNHLKDVVKIIKKLYYGDSLISDEECKEMENAYLSKVNSYIKNDSHKINYSLIVSDAKVNRIIEQYTYGINSGLLEVVQACAKTTTETKIDASNVDTIKNLFNELNDDIQYKLDAFEKDRVADVFEKIMYRYYSKRKDSQSLAQLCQYTQESVPFIQNKLDQRELETEEAIRNVVLHNMGHQSFIQRMGELLEQKQHLRDIYSQFNIK